MTKGDFSLHGLAFNVMPEISHNKMIKMESLDWLCPKRTRQVMFVFCIFV